MADCAGDSLIDRLDSGQRARLTAAVAARPHAEGLIWQALRGDDRVILVGTMHVWDPRLEAVLAEAAPHLATAGHALFEMTAREQDQLMRALAADPALTVITSGPILPERLDAATWDMLAAAARDRGIPPFMAARMQPWFLATALATPACAMAALEAGQPGLDAMLIEAATTAGIPVAALEPWDTLLGLFDQVAFEDQIDLLRLGLVAPDLQDAMFVAMLDGYFAGRVAEVWELNRIALDFMPALAGATDLIDTTEAALLTGRNRAWIPVIEAAAAAHDTVFVGAGAAHLPGDSGVLRLLEQNGWVVTRLDP